MVIEIVLVLSNYPLFSSLLKITQSRLAPVISIHIRSQLSRAKNIHPPFKPRVAQLGFRRITLPTVLQRVRVSSRNRLPRCETRRIREPTRVIGGLVFLCNEFHESKISFRVKYRRVFEVLSLYWARFGKFSIREENDIRPLIRLKLRWTNIHSLPT